MTGAGGDEGSPPDGPTRRRLLRATGGLALLGTGLAGSVDRAGRVGHGDGPPGDRVRDVVAFCGTGAVCTSSEAVLVVADGGDRPPRREPVAAGCHVPSAGDVVAVEVEGQRLANPGSAPDRRTGPDREPAARGD